MARLLAIWPAVDWASMKDIVEQIDNCTFEMAQPASKVSSWATTKGLADLTRSGSEPTDRVFHVEEKKKGGRQRPEQAERKLTLEEKALLPCPRYSNFQNCRFGPDRCHYSHSGVGGTRDDAIRLAKERLASASGQGASHAAPATPAQSNPIVGT